MLKRMDLEKIDSYLESKENPLSHWLDSSNPMLELGKLEEVCVLHSYTSSYLSQEILLNSSSFFSLYKSEIWTLTKTNMCHGLYIFASTSISTSTSTSTSSCTLDSGSSFKYYIGSSSMLPRRIGSHYKVEVPTLLSRDLKDDNLSFRLYVITFVKPELFFYTGLLELWLVRSLLKSGFNLNCSRGEWNSKSFWNVLSEGAYTDKSSLGERNYLYNSRLPSDWYGGIKRLHKILLSRSTVIISCEWFSPSNMYARVRKFESVSSAASYYQISIRLVKDSILQGSHPGNFSLCGLGVKIPGRGCCRLYFFELEDSLLRNSPLICYTSYTKFLGYFVSLSSAEKYLRISSKEISKNLIVSSRFSSSLCSEGSLSNNVDHSITLPRLYGNVILKMYKMNLVVQDRRKVIRCERKRISSLGLKKVVRKDWLIVEDTLKWKVVRKFKSSELDWIIKFYGVSLSSIYRSARNKVAVKCKIKNSKDSYKKLRFIRRDNR